MRRAVGPSDPPLTARGALRWAVVEPLLAGLHPVTVLELGCGQGAVGARIARHARYTGVEPDQSSYDVAAARITPRGGTVLHGDDGVLPWGTTYDVVCAFEVLEHIQDDQAALRSWLKHLRKGGHVVVSVPEGPDRFGASDVQVGHHRRYTEGSLADLLRAAGLEVEQVVHSGWPLGYLLERVSNRTAGRALRDAEGDSEEPPADRSAGSGRWLQPGAVAGAALRVGVRPFAAVQGRRTDRGTGLVAVARRPISS
jgi:SAM-dependent methyltransferase